ncbi:MAG: TPM domain-containing protein [Lewinellaceae bacterium]|nr:TPM domain-containing protein [Lewinellaceae bacterium]
MIHFFTQEDEKRIIAAIRAAEVQTSGEIRVHLHEDIQLPVMDEAKVVFLRLGMQKTQARNGVLFFIVPQKNTFAILGDQGINAVVPPDFWDSIRDLLQGHFREGRFAEGLCQGILAVGEKLREFFPYQTQDDINELPDDISYGDSTPR